MIYLRKIELQSFRSVADKQTIPLPSRGLHLIVGPSGAGKTTLIEGIAFALGYSNFSATDLQSWTVQTPLVVSVELNTPQGECCVTRGKFPSITLPGESKQHTSAKVVKEKLAQMLGGKAEVWLPLTYRSQKSPGFLLSKTDGEKKEFLTQLLGFDKFEGAIETTKNNIVKLEQKVEGLKQLLDVFKSNLIEPKQPVYLELNPDNNLVQLEFGKKAVQQLIEELNKNKVTLQKKREAVVQDVQDKWVSLIAESRKTQNTNKEEELAQIREQVAAIQKQHLALVANLQKSIEVNECLLNLKKKRNDQIEQATQKIKQIQDRIKQLADTNKCYVCGQDWISPERESQFNLEIQQLKDKIEQLNKDKTEPVEDVEELKSKLNLVLLQKPQELIQKEKELAQKEKELAVLVAQKQSKIREMELQAKIELDEVSKLSPEEIEVLGELNKQQNEFTKIRYQIEQINQRNQAIKNQNALIKQHFLEAKGQHDKQVSKINQTTLELECETGKLNQEKDFLELTKGFLAYIFDETLRKISEATNARLALIPNVSDITLRFEAERETSSGKIRQEIVPVLEKGGRGIPLRAGVSGGMLTAIELAVDLSLSEVIAERIGVTPGWLFLDEAFEGLDVVCKEACMSMLREVAKNKAVFIVDHAAEIHDQFDSQIQVKLVDGKTIFMV